MQVKIDQAADAALITWADRRGGRSRTVDLPNGKTVRLLLDQAGELAGLEVLGWWRRAQNPLEVQVLIEDRPAEAVGPHDPLGEALERRGLNVSAADGRPIESGLAMVPMSEVAERTGLERSWLTREAAAGRLRARKIGREWWTTDAWIKAYEEDRATRPRTAARSAMKT
jgi:hypothetical protein